ncbi:uncharacterized protein LOC110884748 isoform X2 [Helianthus annuus]|uniref:uncharacterized protein LOC110884748 isoform X2 n=1 Tax=Helianthus annuus TaxID=4232 RepID=UPI000B903672|nr:uncharacterized protein LOC110884748 isoform X2 [Helianthus annuus]
MGLEDNGVIRSSSIWKKARIGENTIIGNLDTGMADFLSENGRYEESKQAHSSQQLIKTCYQQPTDSLRAYFIVD